MPIYEYGCENCGKIDEVLQSLSEEPLKECRFCGSSSVRKLISRSSFHLKGSGWYVTDYGGKNSSTESTESSTENSVAAGTVASDDTKTEEN